MKRVVLGVIAIVMGVLMPAEAWADTIDTPSPSDPLPPAVLITALSTGDSLSAADEFIAITNVSDIDTDVTNWCLNYASATNNSTGNKLACLTVKAGNQIILPAGASASFASTLAITNHPGLTADTTFSGGLSGTGGHVLLVDASSVVIDKLGWGSAKYPLVTAAPAPSISQILIRGTDDANKPVNDNNNGVDFSLVVDNFVLPAGSLIEQPIPQPEPPDENDTTAPPDDNSGDVDNNTEENPDTIPPDPLPLPPLQLTELFPNPAGIDSGSEFIELYNSSDHGVDLNSLKLVYGLSQISSLPLTGTIEPLSYLAIYNSDHNFTLNNTSGQVSLQTSDGRAISITDPYGNAKDGMTWAYIDSSWQWTNIPTPGGNNQPTPIVIPAATLTSTLKACADNQYRNPATGRCKKIADEIAALVPCAEGEERNPITNRCRKITSDTANTPTPCPEGKERNPDTNRCRNIVNSTPPSANYGVLGTSTQNDHNNYIWTVMFSVVSAGLVYGILEWRSEIGRGARKLYTSIYAYFRH